MMRNARLGRVTNEGVEKPEKTISGRDYAWPATTLDLGDGYFAVVDAFLPPGFDLDGEIAELKTSVTARTTPGRQTKTAATKETE